MIGLEPVNTVSAFMLQIHSLNKEDIVNTLPKIVTVLVLFLALALGSSQLAVKAFSSTCPSDLCFDLKTCGISLFPSGTCSINGQPAAVHQTSNCSAPTCYFILPAACPSNHCDDLSSCITSLFPSRTCSINGQIANVYELYNCSAPTCYR